jgi:uncharacterized protein
MKIIPLHVFVLSHHLAILKILPSIQLPEWISSKDFFSVTCSPGELSLIVCEHDIPENIPYQGGWCALEFKGDSELPGILASVVVPLTNSDISFLIISSYDKDYALVKFSQLPIVLKALSEAGHTIHR